MLKKTLLSLAVAATTLTIAGCNLSTTDEYENEIRNEGVPYGATSSFYPIFAPEASQVPLGIDFLFADAATSDGTANTADTSPPVTTAINKLDGFSTVAPIYIELSEAADAATVVAGRTVLLAKMNTGTKDGKPEPLMANTGDPFSATQITADDYEARPIDMNGKPAIQILLKKPLSPKTKYLVILTDAIKSTSGAAIGQSTTYGHVLGNDGIANSALAPVRTQVQGWKQLADGYLASYPAEQGKAIFNYTFTTGGGDDVLKAMAAPGTFIESQVKGQITSIAIGEGAISLAQGSDAEAALNDIAAGVAQQVNAANAETAGWVDLPTDGATVRPTLKGNDSLKPYYLAGLIKAINTSKGDTVAAIDDYIDAPKSRDYTPIILNGDAVSVGYDAFFTKQVTGRIDGLVGGSTAPAVNKVVAAEGIITQSLGSTAEATLNGLATTVANEINTEAAGSVAGTNGAEYRQSLKSDDSLAGIYLNTLTSTIVGQLSSKGAIYQGALPIPSYLPNATAGSQDIALGSWTASDDAADELGLGDAPRDVNGSTNVTYRFPFAHYIEDIFVPVMATLPAESKCGQKPADGWPVAIYSHGITADRTAGVLVGNALANACVAMVAIDHVMHGVGPTSATGLVFNVNTQAAGAELGQQSQGLSPFALARDQYATGPLAALKERHNNVGKDSSQANVDMVFKDGKVALGDPQPSANVGASGDLYINLMNFSRTRDAMRQTVMDLLNLNASLGAMDVDGGGAAFDTSKVYFIGHSLGGIIGTTFVAVNNDPEVRKYNANLPEIKAAILGNAGGGVVKLLENSPTIGSGKILPGLQAAAGLTQGSADIEKFFGVFQAMVDSVDPINFASAAHMQTLPVLSYTQLGDSVVPNNAEDAAVDTAKSYLAGTDPLVKALGVTTVLNSATPLTLMNGENVLPSKRVSIRIAADKGTHSTFSSADPQATFAEIFGQIGSFLAEKAAPDAPNPLKLTGIKVANPAVLEQAE